MLLEGKKGGRKEIECIRRGSYLLLQEEKEFNEEGSKSLKSPHPCRIHVSFQLSSSFQHDRLV